MASEEAIRSIFRDWFMVGVAGAPMSEDRIDAMVAVWVRVLAHVRDDDLAVRADQWLTRSTSKWWPIPSEVMQMPGTGKGPVALSDETQKRMQKRAEEIAGELWAEVVLPVARKGAQATQERFCEDETEEEAVREGVRACGGFRRVGGVDAESRAMSEIRGAFLSAAASVLVERWRRKVRVVGRM